MTRALVLLALLIWVFGAGMAVERHRGTRMLRMLLRAHVRATADLADRLGAAEAAARTRGIDEFAATLDDDWRRVLGEGP